MLLKIQQLLNKYHDISEVIWMKIDGIYTNLTIQLGIFTHSWHIPQLLNYVNNVTIHNNLVNSLHF